MKLNAVLNKFDPEKKIKLPQENLETKERNHYEERFIMASDLTEVSLFVFQEF